MRFNDIEESIHIIVCVKYKEKYRWYLSDKEFWIMDFIKYQGGTSDDERFGIEVLDISTIEDFLKNISSYEISTKELQKEFKEVLPVDNWDEVNLYMPSLLLDFDSQQLYSLFQDMLSFEEYIPDSWEGKFEMFYNQIPTNSSYWIIENKNQIEHLLS